MGVEGTGDDRLSHLLLLYLEALARRGLSPETQRHWARFLRQWIEFLKRRSCRVAGQLTARHVEAFVAAQSRRRVKHGPRRGQCLTPASVRACGMALKGFTRWLFRLDHVLVDPAHDLRLLPPPPPVPRALSIAQVERLLAHVSGDEAADLRDRAILELAYSSGLRVSELAGLDLQDIDIARCEVHVRHGKGGRARRGPVGGAAVQALMRYLERGRLELASRAHPIQALFLSQTGTRYSRHSVSEMIGRRARAAGLPARVTVHVLRHTFATHMLRGKASLRHVQELLGHARVTTTQIYTRVDLTDLKEVHRRCHPRGRA